MQPFKLRIDWTCHNAYGDQVQVELHVMGQEPTVIHEATSIARAIDYALRWFAGRGFDYTCNVDLHQRLDHTHITLYPQPQVVTTDTPS